MSVPQDIAAHHAANAAAIIIPTMSFLLNAPQILTGLTAFLGVIWYAILIGEKLIGWVKQSRNPRDKWPTPKS